MERQPIVYLVDDDVRTRDAVRDLTRVLNLACANFSSGQEFLTAYDASRRGCVLLEVRMPGLNGLQVQRYLTDIGATSPVVFLAAQATVSMAVRTMRNGAIHFLEKPIREHDLWDTVQEAIRLDEERKRLRIRQELLDARLGRLTESQHELMQMIAGGKTNREVAGTLRVCVRTIESRRSQLMERLEARSLTELVYYALYAQTCGANPENGSALEEGSRPVRNDRLSRSLGQMMVGLPNLLTRA